MSYRTRGWISVGAWMLSLVLAITVRPVAAAVEVYDFSRDEDYARYRQLTVELRCPKCQNQNIADSNAEIARDLRQEVHRLIEEGRSNDEVVDYMVSRYGDFVRYRPPLDAQTLVLWVGPFVLLAIGIGVVLGLARRKRQEADAAGTVSVEERERLTALLRQDLVSPEQGRGPDANRTPES